MFKAGSIREGLRVRHHWFGLVALAVAALLAAACQTEKAMPLEEAKEIAARFQGTPFSPPPRTIEDLYTILDQQRTAQPEAALMARQRAGREPPPGLEPAERVKFRWQRGLAAGKIGDVRRQLADLRTAERLSRASDRKTRARILWDLSVAEILAGNFGDSIRHREASISLRMTIGNAATLALHYARQGDLDAADRLQARAEEKLDDARLWESWARWGNDWIAAVHRAKANILDSKGRHGETEPIYRSALAAAETAVRNNPDSQYGALLREVIETNLARNLTHQGRLVEAEIAVRRALALVLARLGRNFPHTANTLRKLATVLDEQGRHKEAARLVRTAIDAYQRAGVTPDSLYLAIARRQLAESLINQERWSAALEQFDRIRNDLSSDAESFEKRFANDPSWALALLATGRVSAARAVAEGAWQHRRRTVGEDHYSAAEALGILAMALAASGQWEAALGAFSTAVSALLSVSGQSRDTEGTKSSRQRRRGLILEAYAELLSEVRGTSLERAAGVDAAAEAFRVVDAIRGRSVQQALAASGARAATRDPGLTDLARREQDARRRMGALRGLLAKVLSTPADQRASKTIGSLRTRV